jgi:hypothetical protein
MVENEGQYSAMLTAHFLDVVAGRQAADWRSKQHLV